MEKDKNEFSYSLEEDYGVLGTNKTGTSKLKFTRMSWNGNPPKYDLRNWVIKNDNETPTRGITLNKEQVIKLRDLLNSLDI